jgi:hypothetical protein
LDGPRRRERRRLASSGASLKLIKIQVNQQKMILDHPEYTQGFRVIGPKPIGWMREGLQAAGLQTKPYFTRT